MVIKIEEIYQEILDSKRNRFPKGTWSDDQDNNLAKRVIKYLIEKVLKWDKKTTLKSWKSQLIIKYKLGGLLSVKYHDSPYVMINDVYPNCFKEWEFQMTPRNYWTKEKALEALKWTIEKKERLTDNKLLEVYSVRWLSNHNLSSPCQIFWGGSPYIMINELYPDHFKEWEFKKTPSRLWTRKKALEALKWTIEERKQMNNEEIRKKISVIWFSEIGLRTPLERYWNDSPFSMINELYPGCFKEWEFQKAPKNYWTRKKALEALKWTIEEKEKLTNEELTKVYSRRWMINQRLITPLERFWKNSPYAMLHELYPGKFKEWELNRAPRGFWTKEKALEALKWTIEEKEKLTNEELIRVYSRRWIINQGLRTPLDKFWNKNPHTMLSELYPNSFIKNMKV
ncbi:hypothetical protein ABHN12_29140 (plasmid) [Bacillus nitratireducens]|uniref:hypothetical protein n=1 Tax=Bacillus nitratireducens TaxID=2026193 RepID=UPI0039BF895C